MRPSLPNWNWTLTPQLITSPAGLLAGSHLAPDVEGQSDQQGNVETQLQEVPVVEGRFQGLWQGSDTGLAEGWKLPQGPQCAQNQDTGIPESQEGVSSLPQEVIKSSVFVSAAPNFLRLSPSPLPRGGRNRQQDLEGITVSGSATSGLTDSDHSNHPSSSRQPLSLT